MRSEGHELFSMVERFFHTHRELMLFSILSAGHETFFVLDRIVTEFQITQSKAPTDIIVYGSLIYIHKLKKIKNIKFKILFEIFLKKWILIYFYLFSY